jgi:hypothetical protein
LGGGMVDVNVNGIFKGHLWDNPVGAGHAILLI